MASVALNLNAAAELIERTGWTRQAFARNSKGEPVTALAVSAVCFCMSGAVRRVENNDGFRGDVERYLIRKGVRPATFNDADGRTKAEVVAELRKWAAVARSEGL